MSTSPERLIGQQIDHYKIISHIDRGGMADVFLAQDLSLNRQVALKILLPALAADDQFVARFQREARTAAQLEHPHIVPIYGVGITGVNQPYIAMQFVDGGDLKQKIKQSHAYGRPFSVTETLQIIRPIADALRAAHQAGIVHRDIKPSNILIRQDGRPVLVDMGIAAVQSGAKLTSTGTLIGTPSYMSPEQASGKGLDGRADLYSLGIILYEMIAGRLPFEAPDSLAVLHKHVYEQPQPLDSLRPGLPPAVVELVHACLRKDPNLRPQSAGDLIQGIDYALQAETNSARRPHPPPLIQTEILSDPLEGLPGRKQPRKSRIVWFLAMFILILLFVAAGLLLIPASPLSISALLGNNSGRPTDVTNDDEDETPPDANGNEGEPEEADEKEIPQGENGNTEADTPGDDGTGQEETGGSGETIIVVATITPSPTLAPTPTNAPTATNSPTPDPRPLVETIGRSVLNQEIMAYQFGQGPNVLIFIGGLHAGAAPSTMALAEQAILWFTDNPERVPRTSSVIIIPNINPDAPRDPGELDGRLNANRVDLNRNWDCEWVRDALWRNNVVPGSGGTAPFSEPETQALRDYMLSKSPRAVVFWEAKATNGLSSPGACGSRTAVSGGLATTYGNAAGYTVADFENLTSQIVNGDGTNWLDSQGIPAIAVLLPDYETIDWGSNLFGIQAIISDFGG